MKKWYNVELIPDEARQMCEFCFTHNIEYKFYGTECRGRRYIHVDMNLTPDELHIVQGFVGTLPLAM